MAITIDDYLDLVDKVKPEDWHWTTSRGEPMEDWCQIDSDGGPICLKGYIKVGQEEIKLGLNKTFHYRYPGVFESGRRQEIASIYSGSLFYGQVHEDWEYIMPIDKRRVAEEGDWRLKAKFEEVVQNIQEYRAETLRNNEAVIKKLLKQPK